jgi:hypothetical protein
MLVAIHPNLFPKLFGSIDQIAARIETIGGRGYAKQKAPDGHSATGRVLQLQKYVLMPTNVV